MKEFKIAVAGAGTVGGNVVKLLQEKGDFFGQRMGICPVVTDISVRNQGQKRPFNLDGITLWSDALTMAKEAEIDLFVELIGGEDGVALDCVKIALSRKLPVVTANKAMLAHHGALLADLTDDNNTNLGYEAAIAGGIPIVKALREGLAGNYIHRLFGIFNGTCNYILTEMRNNHLSFDHVLKEAQQKGYAEADPTLDIDGIDAAHKLCLLTALAFGVKPDFDSVQITGIRNLNSIDIAFAEELGRRIKLLGFAERLENGRIRQTVAPFLVPKDAPIAAVEGVYNGVVVQGDYVGTSLYEGLGAGGEATASAVVADILDQMQGRVSPVFSCPQSQLGTLQPAHADQICQSHYVRLNVIDRPGVIAEIASVLKEYQLSLNSIIQHGRDPMAEVALMLVTHESDAETCMNAIQKISSHDYITTTPQILPIMD